MKSVNPQNNTASLWKILVLSLIIFSFIFGIPLYLNKKWDKKYRKYPVKYVEEFNKDAKIVDEFNHIFVNENLKEHLPYDYNLLEELYSELELDAKDTIEKSRLPHDRYWKVYHTGVLVSYLVERLANRVFTRSIWVNFIIYPLCIFLGAFLTFLIAKKYLNPFYHKKDILTKLRQKSTLFKVFFSILLFSGYRVIVFIRSLSMEWELNSFLGDSFPNFLTKYLLRAMLYIVSLYCLYLLASYLKKTKAKWISLIIDWTFLIFAVRFSILLVHSKRYSLWSEIKEVVTLSYHNLFTDKLLPYVGFERFIAFGLIILLILSLVTFLLFILFRIIHPKNREFRIVNGMKYITFVILISVMFSLMTGRLNKLQSRGEHQHLLAQKNIMASRYQRVSAEVYQWYHQQKDANRSTEVIPTEFISYLKERDDFEFSYNWDGTHLETELEYVQDDGTIRTIINNLNVETGVGETKGVNDE